MTNFNYKKFITENKLTQTTKLRSGMLTEGQFSWMTQDTGQQIGSEEENTIPVYMFDDKGKYYYENEYDGYGVFGGKDYYELLDQMNGGSGDRSRGIDLAFGKEKTGSEILFPALVTSPSNFNYKNHDFTKEPESDPNQSWYAPEEDDFYDQNDEEVYGYEDDEEELDEALMDDDEIMGIVKVKPKQNTNTPYSLSQLNYKLGKEVAEKIVAALEKEGKEYMEKFLKLDTNEKIHSFLTNFLNPDFDKKKLLDEVKTTNTKMKISELKAKIKEMIVAETNTKKVEEVDFLAELEGMLDEADSLTPLQDYVYQYEIEISGEDRAQEFLDDIKQLKTPQDVYDYYAYGRGWEGSDLNNIFRQVKRKFASSNTADDLTPLQKQAYSYAKERFGFEDAKNSLDQIKTLTTRDEFWDWVKKKIEAENSLNEASEFDTNKPARIAEFITALNRLVDDYHAELYLNDDLFAAIEMVIKAAKEEATNLNEASKDEEVDADVEAADDTTGEDTTAGEEAIDTTVDVSTTEVNPDVKSVQDALTQAQAAAQKLGDPKLTDQIGNTITFFTRSHVVEKPTSTAENLNESMFPMLKKILK